MFFLLGIVLLSGIGAYGVWRSCRRPLRAAALVLATLAALAVLPLASGQAVRPVYDDGLGALIPVAPVLLLSLLVLRFALPRLEGRRSRPAVLALTAFLVLAHLTVALLLWRAADEGLQLENVPVARSEPEILALRQGPTAPRLFGVLTVARAGGPEAADGSEIARYDCSGFWSADDSWFPTFLPLTLADGKALEAEGPRSGRQAWNWPPGDLRLGQCALRSGDPVVVWADVAEARTLEGGGRLGALVATRLVAHGDLESFRRDYVPRAAFTGRYFSWLALAAAVLALLPLAAGVRRLRRR